MVATTRPATPTRATQAIRRITIVGGVAFVAFGLGAFAGPQSFVDQKATFDPYNPHLSRDIGAFQLRLAALLLWTGIAALRSPG